MARLSTHVLDTSRGMPAAGMGVRLFAIVDGVRSLIKAVSTNADGRTDEPLMAGDRIATGVFELEFAAGRYFGIAGEQAFLDEVMVRFRLSDPAGNYHVPLLVSPYGYTTYKGS